MSTSSAPSSSQDSKAVTEFCVAKKQLETVEEEYAKQRKPLSERHDQIRTQLKAYMKEHKLSCLPVQISTADAQTGQTESVKRYLRFSTTSAIGALGAEGLKRAVLGIESADLENAYDSLQTKQQKKPSQTKIRKLSSADSSNGSGDDGAISNAQVWEQALTGKIRAEHLHKSETLRLTTTPERKALQNSSVIAPPQLVKLVQEWHDLSLSLEKLLKQKNVKTIRAEQVIEHRQSAVCAYLDKQREHTQEIQLSHREQVRPYLLTQKESKPKVQVRITKFTPYLHDSLVHVVPDSSTGFQKSPSASALNQIKLGLVPLILQQYAKYQTDHQEIKRYVALDKVPVRT